MESKSETIRRLYREGKNPAEIARELGLTYQRVYNTLKRSGLLSPKREEPDPEAYRKFIQELEIRSVELLEAHAKLDRAPQGKKGVSVSLEAFGPEEVEGGFRAGLAFQLNFQDDQGSFGFINIRVAARYKSPRFPEGNVFQIFKERNLPVNLWPYLRLYTDFFTGQMGLPRLTLPAFKV